MSRRYYLYTHEDMFLLYPEDTWIQDWNTQAASIRAKLRELEESELKFQGELLKHKEHECHKS